MSARAAKAATAAVIAELCKEMKLPTIVANYPTLCRQAQDGDWSYEAFLHSLLEQEVLKRHQNVAQRRVREARFPYTKTLDQLDWSALRGVSNRRTRVAFVRAAELVRQLVEARDDRQLGRLHRRYQRVDLLIIDELGFVPLDKTESELIFNLLADRYERRSTVVTSNLAFGEWVQVFGSEKLTTALLDRLAHHAHVLTTKGVSFRTNKRRTKKN